MKVRRIRPVRFIVKIYSYIQRNSFFLLAALVFAVLSITIRTGYLFLKGHDVTPQDLLGFFGTPAGSLDSTDGITNFLVLGIRGEGHDSPNLSDTIIILSYDHTNKSTSLLSIPRDLWVPSMKAKINTAYHYGEEASSGAGLQLASAAVLEDLGVPINYTAVVNFSLFEQAIDLVGGVDIHVTPGFSDTEFPIPGRENALPVSSRYETITFAEGLNHFDGSMALKYVRSRHAEGEEGTDFSRSRRQQQVISALRQKVLTPSFLLDKQKVESLINIVSQNLITNISPKLFPTLAKLAFDSRDHQIRSLALSDTPDSNGIAILYHPPIAKFSGEWVLMPKDNNWNALKQYVKNFIRPDTQTN